MASNPIPGADMTYSHTQAAPLYWLLLAFAIVEAAVAPWLLRIHWVPALVLLASAALMLFLAFSFKHLTIRDAGDHLLIHFGPIPLFRKRIYYDTIRSAAPGRSSFIDGWGIHYRPGLGWIWNLWGYDCVVLTLRDRTFRVGTDDAPALAAFLQSRLAPR